MQVTQAYSPPEEQESLGHGMLTASAGRFRHVRTFAAGSAALALMALAGVTMWGGSASVHNPSGLSGLIQRAEAKKLEGTQWTCSAAGKGCLETRCCRDPANTCFLKNDKWADCKPKCEPGKVDPNSPKDLQSPWNCTKLTKCSVAGKGCMDTGCCQDKALTCFVKNDHWADCKPKCEAGKVDPNSPKDLQSPWSCEKKCSKGGDGCLETGCCQDPQHTCFKKNDKWADCKKTCEPGEVDPNSPKDQQSPWSCERMTMVNATNETATNETEAEKEEKGEQ